MFIAAKLAFAEPHAAESPTIERLLAYGDRMNSVQATAESNRDSLYELRSWSLTQAPQGSEGNWYQYVIARGASLIVGLRCGTEAEVDYFLHDTVERLNERRLGKTRPRIKPARPAN